MANIWSAKASGEHRWPQQKSTTEQVLMLVVVVAVAVVVVELLVEVQTAWEMLSRTWKPAPVAQLRGIARAVRVSACNARECRGHQPLQRSQSPCCTS